MSPTTKQMHPLHLHLHVLHLVQFSSPELGVGEKHTVLLRHTTSLHQQTIPPRPQPLNDSAPQATPSNYGDPIPGVFKDAQRVIVPRLIMPITCLQPTVDNRSLVQRPNREQVVKAGSADQGWRCLPNRMPGHMLVLTKFPKGGVFTACHRIGRQCAILMLCQLCIRLAGWPGQAS